MQVSEVMHKGINTVQINDSLKDVASLMKRKDIGAVPVYKNERPVGFVTDRDIVVSCVANGSSPDEPISLAMNQDLFYVKENDDINAAAKLMKDKQISRILVVDEGDNPTGMLSLHDIARHRPEKLDETVSEIKH